MSRPLRSLVVACLTVPAIAAGTAHAASAPATVWLCKPGLKNDPCAPSQTTARYTPTGAPEGIADIKPARHPKIDCFYVYPTVSDQQRTVATRAIDPVERSVALYQAARYSRVCRVFAPIYRQYTLRTINNPTANVSKTLVSPKGYADVVQAWRSYLRNDNHGRGVVLIGHSQGTFVLRRFIAREIDPDPAARRLLVSAILLGGNVLVRKGGDVGGDFKHVPACRSASQLGCVIAFSTFGQPPPANAIFGRTTTKGMAVLCTNPAALGGGSGVLDPVFPTAPFATGTIAAATALVGEPIPKTTTPWVEIPGAYTARCTAGGAHVLQIAARGGAPALNAVPDATWGLHLADANIALGNLTSIVSAEAKAFAAR
jgi:pimeloyl-ACP methyl ester carboxylesterase